MNKNCMNCKYWDKEAWETPCCKCDCCYDGEKIKFTEYEPMVEETDDPVSHPNHYQSKTGLEVIDAIKAFTEDCEGIEGYYTGNVIKYVCRWKKKNGLEDLKKARQYLDWLIEKVEKKELPKNGRYSMKESDCCSGECKCKSKEKDCFVPWQIQPKMVPTYELGMSAIGKQGAVEIIWDQFCDAFLNALKEVSKEEKETKEDEE